MCTTLVAKNFYQVQRHMGLVAQKNSETSKEQKFSYENVHKVYNFVDFYGNFFPESTEA